MGSKIVESSGDIFKELGFSAEESEKMNIKSHLMAEIETFIKTEKLTNWQASKIMGVSRLRISDVLQGKIDRFTIDALVEMLAKAGRHMHISVEKARKPNSITAKVLEDSENGIELHHSDSVKELIKKLGR